MTSTELEMRCQLMEFWAQWGIITYRRCTHKYHWCSMMECGLGKEIMYRMADDIVKKWVTQGITDLNDFHEGEDGKTPAELAEMVGGLVDDYLVSLLGV